MGTTWCILNGGPADGAHIPMADNYCTRRIVIYRADDGPPFARPAVYLRDQTDQGEYEHRGADGVLRTSPSLGYTFERHVSRALARKIEAVRKTEAMEG